MSIRISLSATHNYLFNIRKCLENLSLFSNPEIELDFIAVDFDPEYLKPIYPRFNFFQLDFNSQVSCKNQHKSPQYGDFLNAYTCDVSKDVIIFIDGDVILQRSFSQEELNYLNSYTEGMFGCNYNSGPDDSIWKEALRLQIKQDPMSFVREWWPNNDIPKCYNTGCCVALGSTWDLLRQKFIFLWEKEGQYIVFPSAQWLMSWILGKDVDFSHQLLSLEFHTHAHFGLYPGITIDSDSFTTRYNGDVCLFRHKIAWQV